MTVKIDDFEMHQKTKTACKLALLEDEEWGRKEKDESKNLLEMCEVLPLFHSIQNLHPPPPTTQQDSLHEALLQAKGERDY